MSQAGRQNNGGGPVPGGAVLRVQTPNGFAVPNGAGVIDYVPRLPTALTTSNIVTSADNNNTFFAAVTDAIYLPATNAAATSGVYGIENLPVLHAMGAAGVVSNNIGVGIYALNLGINNGVNNTALGAHSLNFVNDGNDNFAGGTGGLRYLTDGSRNTVVGSGAFGLPGFFGGFTGDDNISIGYNSSNLMDRTAHDNIAIGSQGGPAINNTTIIGSNVAPHNQTTCFIHGIWGNIGGTHLVTIDNTGQLQTTAIANNGVQFFNVPDPLPGPHRVDPDVVDGHINFVDGPNILIDEDFPVVSSTIRVSVTPNITLQPTNGAGTQGVYLYGANRFMHCGGSVINTFLGRDSGNYTAVGILNTCIGDHAGTSLTNGNTNSIIGGQSGQNITSGARNTLCGAISAPNITTAENVTALGYYAGFFGDNNQLNNIWIGNWGVVGVNDRITIGTDISHAPEQRVHTACYIHGIWTRPVAAGYQQVVIDATGKLGSLVIGPGAGITYRASDASTTTATAGNVITFNSGDGNLTSHAAANAVSYSLANSIVVNQNITATLGTINSAGGPVTANTFMTAGSFMRAGSYMQAGTTITAGTGITSTLGNILAAGGDVIANQTLIAQNGGADITGNIFFNTYATGILQVNNAGHAVTSSNGTDGQILRARGAGNLPLWNTLVAGPGIAIDITNANQITISTAVAAALTFQAKDGSTAAPAANRIIFTGDPNVVSTAAGNTVTYALAYDVTIPGTMWAQTNLRSSQNTVVGVDLNVERDAVILRNTSVTGNITAINGSITANNGNIATLVGNISSADSVVAGTFMKAVGNITSTTGNVSANQQLIAVNNGCDITGPIYLRSAALPVGVAQMNNLQQLYSTNATANGQVLIGAAGGTNPTWHTLTAGAGIAITNAPSSITISATGAPVIARPCFSAYLTAAAPGIWGSATNTAYIGLAPVGGVTVVYQSGVTLVTGGGATLTRFQAITAGLYQFTFKVEFSILHAPGNVDSMLYIRHGYPALIYNYTNISRAYNLYTGLVCDTFYTQLIYVNAGESVVFGIDILPQPATPGQVGLTTNTFIEGFLVS